MVRQLDAVFEEGVLRPLEPLVLVEHQRVRLTIEELADNGPGGLSAIEELADNGPGGLSAIEELAPNGPDGLCALDDQPIMPPENASFGERRLRHEELLWLAREAKPYAGQWVALSGSRLVAHGSDAATVRAAARASGVERPLLTHLPEDADLPFGGWWAVPRLQFSHVYSYASHDSTIALPIVLRSGGNVVDLVASLDTGASYCLFEGAYATELGLDLHSGVRKRFRTANSNFDAYGHEVEIDAFGIVTHSLVFFFADASIVKNVLGRGGWLDRVRVGIVDHDCTLFLAPYGDGNS
jgi:predicted DNA-binding antitoxin AbrB/MazE fold protein